MKNDKMRHLGDSNPYRQSPADSESASLTTRTRCLQVGGSILGFLVNLFAEVAEFAKIMLVLHVPNANHKQERLNLKITYFVRYVLLVVLSNY